MPKRSHPKAEKRSAVNTPFKSHSLQYKTACFGKQPHKLSTEFVPQHIDHTARRGLDGQGQYSGKQVPDDLVFSVCTNTDGKGRKCSYRICVGMVEAF